MPFAHYPLVARQHKIAAKFAIEKGDWAYEQKRRRGGKKVKALIKSLENKPLDPCRGRHALASRFSNRIGE